MSTHDAASPAAPDDAVAVQRRAWLQLAAALALTGALPRGVLAQARADPQAASFAALGAALTGYPAPDAATVARVQRAFATPARSKALASLAQIVATTSPADLDHVLAARGLATIANELVATWYSGTVPGASSGQVVLYANAFMWSAMTWTKPMGVCGGVTGYWADPPTS